MYAIRLSQVLIYLKSNLGEWPAGDTDATD